MMAEGEEDRGRWTEAEEDGDHDTEGSEDEEGG
jgi:hypothetical protein